MTDRVFDYVQNDTLAKRAARGLCTKSHFGWDDWCWLEHGHAGQCMDQRALEDADALHDEALLIDATVTRALSAAQREIAELRGQRDRLATLLEAIIEPDDRFSSLSLRWDRAARQHAEAIALLAEVRGK